MYIYRIIWEAPMANLFYSNAVFSLKKILTRKNIYTEVVVNV